MAFPAPRPAQAEQSLPPARARPARGSLVRSATLIGELWGATHDEQICAIALSPRGSVHGVVAHRWTISIPSSSRVASRSAFKCRCELPFTSRNF
eukprot:7981835-Pyramimonas_sp.AAC.1